MILGMGIFVGGLAQVFFLLAIGDISGNHGIIRLAGWEGIFCGASAFYAAIAQILNEIYGKTVLPVGPMNK